MLSSEEAAERSATRAASTADWSRLERHSSSAAIAPASTAGSTRRIPPSSPSCSGEGSASVYTFFPTTASSPVSIRRMRSRCDSTICVFMYGTAATAPPRSATSAISSRAPATSSDTRPSMTFEPSKMSG